MSFKNGKFGQLTIRREISPDIFECDCECGNLLDVWRSLLTSGVQLDCGMCRRFINYRRRDGKVIRLFRKVSIHGHSRIIHRKNGTLRHLFTREHVTWRMMVQRCHDKKFQYYDRYGGKGIRVCKRWREPNGHGLLNFLRDMGPRPLSKTLDRINCRGHYEPTNCRWADIKVQSMNRGYIIWKHCPLPPIEKVREMEARVAKMDEELHPF